MKPDQSRPLPIHELDTARLIGPAFAAARHAEAEAPLGVRIEGRNVRQTCCSGREILFDGYLTQWRVRQPGMIRNRDVQAKIAGCAAKSFLMGI